MVTILRDGIHVCRKPRTCDQCLRLIEVGQRYRKQVTADGDLSVYRAHESCDAAVTRYVELADLHPLHDTPPLLIDLGVENNCWIIEEFPDVADRLGIAKGMP
jgi:hypothetical protein